MKIQSVILALFMWLACACQQEEQVPTQALGLDQAEILASAASPAGMSSMSGMIGEIRINSAGDGQCHMAHDPADMTSYSQLLENILASNNNAVSSSAVPVQNATANINVTYLNFTSEAQTSFQSAVDTWSGSLTSEVDINVIAVFTPLDPGVLGSAGSTLILRDAEGLQSQTWYGMALADRLVGTDLVPGDFDIIAFFSSVFPNWYFGTDGQTPADQFDFRSVVLHELCHGLGFFGSATVDAGGIGSIGFGTPFPAIYDRFGFVGSGDQLTRIKKVPNPSELLGDVLTDGEIFFSGRNVLFATGGDPAKLFTFPVWLQGSSYSHLDEFTYLPGTENGLMTPFIGTGESYAQPGPIVLGMFDDIGWNGRVTKPTLPPN